MKYKIEMNIPNYKLIIKENKGIINDKSVFITKDDYYDIFRVIRLWKESYKDNSIINENKYYINIYEDGKLVDKFEFDGAFPDNFHNLVSIIGEIYGR